MLERISIHQVKDGADQTEAEESGADQHGYGDDHFQCIGKTGNDKSTFFFHRHPPQISSVSC